MNGLWHRNNKWYINIYVEGKRIRKLVGTNKREAEHVVAIIKADAVRGKYNFKKEVENPTFKDFAKVYIEYAKGDKKSWQRDVTSLNNLIPYFGGKRLSEITSLSIENYKTMRREKVKPATVNRELACFKHMFNLAIGWDKAEDNPVKKVKLFKEVNQMMRILSAEEEEKLMKCASLSLKPVLVTALATGMRIGEILELTWDKVDLERGVITVDNTKNGKSRYIPINSRLSDVLRKIWESSKSKRVFMNRNGASYESTRTAFETARRKAGIENLRMHDLRHTFASRLVMNGVDLATVKELLGHETIAMTLRYSHPTPEHKKKAVESLNSAKSSHYLDTGEEK